MDRLSPSEQPPMRRPLVTCALAAPLIASILAGLARAQQLPAAGTQGFLAFTNSDPNSIPFSDFYTVLNLNGGAFPAGSSSTTALVRQPLSSPFSFPFVPLRTALTLNERKFFTQTEPKLAMGFDGISPNPVVLIPAEDTGAVNPWVVLFDHRPGMAIPTRIALQLASSTSGATASPYEIVVHPSLPRAYVSWVKSNGNLILDEIDFSTSVPFVASSYAAPGAPSPFASRVVIDSSSNRIAIPWIGGIDVVAPGALGTTLYSFPAPNGYVIGTNPTERFKGANQQNVLVGLRAAGGGFTHAWMAVSPLNGSKTQSGVDPFGAGRQLGVGFYEIGITNTSSFTTATFLLDQIAFPVNTGATGQITNRLATSGIGAPVTALLPASPIGNPEPMRTGNGDPVAFHLSPASAGGNEIVGVVGAGSACQTLGATALLTMGGVTTPQTVDRPLALPGGIEFAITGTTQFELYGVGCGPSLTLNFTFPAPSPVTTLGNVMTSGLLGPQPVFMQGFIPAYGLLASFPFPTTALAFLAGSAGVLPLNRVVGVLPPTFGARRPVFNFVNGSATQIRYVYPVTFGSPAKFAVEIGSTAGSGVGRYTDGGVGFSLLTSEILAF